MSRSKQILVLPLALAAGVLNLASCGQAGALYLVAPPRPAPAVVTAPTVDAPGSSQAAP